MTELAFARVTGGDTFEYLKDIDLFGRITENEEFVVYGCKDGQEKKFYQGILELDRKNPVFGFESVDEVEEYWMDGGDGLYLNIEKGCYEVATIIEESKIKIFGDDYVTIVAETKEQAEKLYVEVFGDLEEVELDEINGKEKTMIFPIDKLPEKYHDESKYTRKDWQGAYIGVEITLNEAIKYKKERPPYILSISDEIC